MVNSLITRCHLFQAAVPDPLCARGHLQDMFQRDMAYIDPLHTAFMGTNFSFSSFIDLIENFSLQKSKKKRYFFRAMSSQLPRSHPELLAGLER